MKSDFLLALRYLNKNKALGCINILGLSIGISACLVIYVIASFELSFDTFHQDGDQIYRVYTRYTAGDVVRDYPGINTDAVHIIRDNVAGVEAYSHLLSWWEKVEIEDGENQPKVFDNGNNFAFVDQNFFKVFSIYTWLEGTPEHSLSDPYRVVLTESRAKKYFGDLSYHTLIGKEIIYKGSLRFSVSGIITDIKENTDFTFTDFISYSTAEKLRTDGPLFDDPRALNNSARLFIKIAPDITPGHIMAQFPKQQNNFELRLQPLKDLHFDSDLSIFSYVKRIPPKKSTIETLIILALALLIAAVINFVNLETAQASKRANEVRIRKVLGSSRWNLIRYFLIESFVLTFISIVLSVFLALLAFDVFKEFIPQGVTLNISSSGFIVFLLILIICVPALAGIYPAFVLSSYQPARTLKNTIPQRGQSISSSLFRKGLTIFQFFLSQVLIIITLVVGFQIRYVLNKDLGFITKGIITFHSPSPENATKKSAMRNRLTQIEGVEMVCMQSQPPSGADGTNSLLLAFEEKEDLEYWVNVKYGDENYLSLYDLKLIAGSSFIQKNIDNGFIVNEAYMHKLGYSNPVDILGKTANKNPIIGVVKNFHTESLHSVIQPTAIVYDSSKLHSFGVKLNLSEVNPKKLPQILNKIESAWNEIYPEDKFEFSFIDNRIKGFYESEQRMNKLASSATGIAVLISCLGLFALSSFTAAERTKEIGIRKVMGASVNSIVILLSVGFLKLVLIAFILSAPLAFYIGEKWLTEFAFKIDMNVWIFLIAGALSVTLAFATISFRTINTAKTDPVKSLRHE